MNKIRHKSVTVFAAIALRCLLGVGCIFASIENLNAQGKENLPADSVIFNSGKFFDFIKLAAFENKPYIVFFSAPWCAPCHRIKQEIFTHPKIVALVNNHYLAYTIDLDNLDGAELNSRFFNVQQLPTVLFFDPRGNPTDKAIGYFDGYYFFKKLRQHIPPALRGKDWLQD